MSQETPEDDKLAEFLAGRGSVSDGAGETEARPAGTGGREFSGDEKQRIIREFARRQQRQLVLTLPVVILMAGAVVAAEKGSGLLFGVSFAVWAPLVVAALVGVVVFSLVNWRCPACRGYLGKGFSPRFCPRCGVQLKR
jgi:hypothetical protein